MFLCVNRGVCFAQEQRIASIDVATLVGAGASFKAFVMADFDKYKVSFLPGPACRAGAGDSADEELSPTAADLSMCIRLSFAFYEVCWHFIAMMSVSFFELPPLVSLLIPRSALVHMHTNVPVRASKRPKNLLKACGGCALPTTPFWRVWLRPDCARSRSRNDKSCATATAALALQSELFS